MSKKSLKLYYYIYPNIGDILNEFLINKLFQIDTSYENYCTAEMMALGSIFDRLLEDFKVNAKEKELRKHADQANPIHIWGTGMIKYYKHPAKLIRPIKVHALRGKLSKDQLERATGEKYLCVLADPGLLAPLLLWNIPEKKYDVGIIPHYVDADADVFQKMKNEYSNSIIIDVKAEPMNVLETIASCKLIISTSLHGLIIADSFGIPNIWCESSDKIIGEGFKYRDYYSSFDLTAEPFDLRKGEIPSLSMIRTNYQVPFSAVKKKQKQLIKCFPFKNKSVWKTYFKLWR